MLQICTLFRERLAKFTQFREGLSGLLPARAGGTFGKNCSVSPAFPGASTEAVLHIMQHGLKVIRADFGKECSVSAPFPGLREASQSVASRRPISRLAKFGADVRHRPMATPHPASDPHSQVIREGFGGLAAGAKRVHRASVTCPLTTPIGKVFQTLFSAFHPRLLRVPRASNPSKVRFFAQSWLPRSDPSAAVYAAPPDPYALRRKHDRLKIPLARSRLAAYVRPAIESLTVSLETRGRIFGARPAIWFALHAS
jgi:hypothetical protein